MKINKVTITGAGNNTDIKALLELTKKYPFVEWGILFSPSRTGKDNRYPSLEWVYNLLRTKKSLDIELNLSAHLCGEYTRKLLSDGSFIHESDLLNILIRDNFKRVQLNFNASKTPESYKFYEFIKFNTQHKFILQNNKSNSEVISKVIKMNLDNIHLLYDGSGGRGVLPETYLPQVDGFYTGYAGGLSPENIIEALGKISDVVSDDYAIWIDTESGVRTDDELDLVKVEKFLKICSPFVLGTEKKEIADEHNKLSELYQHRNMLFICLCRSLNNHNSSIITDDENVGIWKTRFDFENKYCGDGWFIMGIGTKKDKQISYHLPFELWENCSFAKTIDKVKNFDGHTSMDVVERLLKQSYL